MQKKEQNMEMKYANTELQQTRKSNSNQLDKIKYIHACLLIRCSHILEFDPDICC